MIFLSILILAAVVIAVLSYNGILNDADNDGIPDEIEKTFEKAKKKVKEKLKKWKNQKHANVETQQILMDIAMALI